MNKKRNRIVVFIFTVICLIATLLNIGYRYLFPMYLSYKFQTDFSDAKTIGFIGGSDGPTAIYIANQLSPFFFTTIFAFLSIIGIIYLYITRNKKDRNFKG